MDWMVTIEMADLDDAQIRGNLDEILTAAGCAVTVTATNGTTVSILIPAGKAANAALDAVHTVAWGFGVLQMEPPSVTWLCAWAAP